MTKRTRQRGVALFFALILVALLSVMGASIMFLAQSETWSSLNYETMTQARYGAESGLNAAANYLVNTYTAPATGGSDPLGNYNTATSPVQYGGNPVVLSTTQSQSNYPVAAVETAFQNAAQGSLAMGNSTVNYTASATLVAMNQVTTAAGPMTVQTWSITADGTTSGVRNAQEEVTGILERQVTFAAVSAPSYGVFATGNQCGALTFSGGVTVGSYDSAHPTFSGGSLVPDAWGGDIGANGNLNESGGARVNGTMSTPRTGVGNCSAGGVDAWTDSGGATVTGCNAAPPAPCVSGGLVHLSQPVTYSTPTMPTMPTALSSNTTITSTTTCASASLSNCSGTAGHLTLTGSSYGNLSLSGGAVLTLSPPSSGASYGNLNISGGSAMTLSTAATYNIQSLTVSGSSHTTVSNTAAMTMNIATSVSLSGGDSLILSGSNPVTVNIVGTTSSSPFTSSGGGITNINAGGAPTPVNLQIMYAGTHTISLSGGTKTAAAVYAPNAPLNLSGGSSWYGSLIGSTINDSGGVSIYYDRELGSTTSSTPIATVGNFMMDSFSWSRF